MAFDARAKLDRFHFDAIHWRCDSRRVAERGGELPRSAMAVGFLLRKSLPYRFFHRSRDLNLWVHFEERRDRLLQLREQRFDFASFLEGRSAGQRVITRQAERI